LEMLWKEKSLKGNNGGKHDHLTRYIGLSIPHRKRITSRYEPNRLMLSMGL
jgi:hypothetical protein